MQVDGNNQSGFYGTPQLGDITEKKDCFHIINGIAHKTYALPDTLYPLLPGKLTEHCKNALRFPRKLYSYDLVTAPWQSLDLKAASRLIAQAAAQQPSHKAVFSDPESKGRPHTALFHINNCTVRQQEQTQLPSPEGYSDGSTLVFINGNKPKFKLTLLREPQDSLIELTGGQSCILTKVTDPETQRSSWKLACSTRSETRKVSTNPLLYSAPSLVSQKGRNIPHEVGEFQLSKEMVNCHLQCMRRPAIHNSVLNSTSEIKSALRNRQSNCLPVSMIFYDYMTEHMTAFRVFRHEGRLVCYLHETLNPGDAAALDIRERIVEALQSHFKEDMQVLCPGFCMQKDFYSCGVFALDAINAFSHFSDLEQRLMTTAVKTSQQVNLSANGKKAVRLFNPSSSYACTADPNDSEKSHSQTAR